jgi:hypothetical protein
MRAILSVLILSAACATTTPGAARPVNVAFVRHEVNDAIARQPDHRAIVSMGHVTDDVAVVYTEKSPGERAEETWIRTKDGWQLQTSHEVASSKTMPSNTN